MPELRDAWIESIGIVDGPANRRRLLLLKAEREPVEKTVVPFKSYPLVESGSWSWNAGAQNAIINGGGWKAYKAAHTYQDPDADPETKAAYKLPHHVWDGGLKTSRRGVQAAMQRLPSTDMPESEKKAAYNHLARHYREFDMEPPELRKSDAKEEDVADKVKKDDVEQPTVEAPETPVAQPPVPEKPELEAPVIDPAPVEKSAEVVALEKRLATLEKAAAEEKKRADDIAKRLQDERDERATQEHIRKAARDYGCLTMKAAEFGPIMKYAQDVLSKDHFEELERVLRAANEAVRKSGVFAERGVAPTDGEDGQGAWERATALAKKAVADGEFKTVAEAREAVLARNPELKREFAKERR